MDSRFAKVYSDPRFVIAPNKVKKVKIDSRFKNMFTDKGFNEIAKVDKYGRKISKKDTHALQNYYEKDGDDSSSEEDKPRKPQQELKSKAKGATKEDLEKKYYDETGNFHWAGGSSSSDEEADSNEHAKSVSSEDSAADYSDVLSGVWSMSEDHDEEQGEEADVVVGKRIAVTNLDWDSISA